MPNLLGTAPNQVPTNADLGKLAFMDVVDTVTNNPYVDTAISDTKPSLLLDFANSKTLDPRITYTRASTATYYDGKTTAKAEENLFRYSQSFANVLWTKSRVTITENATTAPDGTFTASSLDQSSGQTNAGTVYDPSMVVNATVYTFSLYAKANTKTFINLFETLADGSTNRTYFNLSSGAAGTVDPTHTATITSVGNGWYRCSITFTANAVRTAFAGVYVADSDNNTVVTDSGGVFIWGAQLEQRSAVSSYTTTTSSPITNYIPALQTAAAGVPRFDHDPVTGESKGFLIEEQRTNLLLYSSQFDNAAWNKINTAVTADTIVAPDGTLTGDKLSCTLTTSTVHQAHQIGISITNAANYTWSVYMKQGEYVWGIVNAYSSTDSRTYFNLATGTVGTVATGCTASITPVGNGWYRCQVTRVSAAASGGLSVEFTNADNTPTFAGAVGSGIYLWGAQLEAGSFATSYIPTTSAQVTRSADAASMTGANFSSWYRADEGTVYSEVVRNSSNQLGYAWAAAMTAASNNDQIGVVYSATATVYPYGFVGGTQQFNFATTTPYTANTGLKTALAYGTNNSAVSYYGSQVANDNICTIPTCNYLYIGQQFGGNSQLNGTIKKLAYYPKRLSDAELQEMTQ